MPVFETIYDNNVKEYWLIFTQGNQLISHFLKKNCSHVYVLTRDKYNWIILNPMRLFLHVEIPAVPIHADLPRMMRGLHDKVIKITIHQRKSTKMFRRFGIFSCVSFALYLIGLRIYALTPFRLYKRLLHLTNKELNSHGIQSIKFIA